MWNTDKLFQKFHTSKEQGLSTAKADELFK
jgi:hypothetical protein